MKKVFEFGKIDFRGTGKKRNLVTIEMEYKECGDKKRFSVRGCVWNARRTDIICGGQILDTIAEYVADPVFLEIHRLWRLYHLNGMHPECEHQAALGWRELYKEHPKAVIGKECPVCGYKYGSRWNYFPIPADDEKIIIDLLRE